MSRKPLDTSRLGPIRLAAPPPLTPLSRQARNLFADEVERIAPGYRNAADSIRAGAYGNMWTVAALAAVERALRIGPDDAGE